MTSSSVSAAVVWGRGLCCGIRGSLEVEPNLTASSFLRLRPPIDHHNGGHLGGLLNLKRSHQEELAIGDHVPTVSAGRLDTCYGTPASRASPSIAESPGSREAQVTCVLVASRG